MNVHLSGVNAHRTAPKVQDHILREILIGHLKLNRCADKHEYNILQARIEDLQREAEQAFAALNGCRVGRRYSGFDWTDHSVRFNRDRRQVAIVGQPYGSPDMYTDQVDAYALQHGMRWHMPPMPYASIWVPGSTLFIVMTKPDVTVRWLPEQENETEFAERHKLERALTREWGEADGR